MVTTGWFRGDLLVLTIDDGARPDRRRMFRGLQPPAAEMSGSRHIRSTFHPPSRLEWLRVSRLTTLILLIEMWKTSRRGGPLCPPARIGAAWLIDVDVQR